MRISIPMSRRMLILAEGGMPYRHIAAAVSLYEDVEVTANQVIYQCHRQGFRGRTQGNGAANFRKTA